MSASPKRVKRENVKSQTPSPATPTATRADERPPIEGAPESQLFNLLTRVASETNEVPELFEIARKVTDLEWRAQAAERDAADWRTYAKKVLTALFNAIEGRIPAMRKDIDDLKRQFDDLNQRHSGLCSARPDPQKGEADERQFLDGTKQSVIAKRRGIQTSSVTKSIYRHRKRKANG